MNKETREHLKYTAEHEWIEVLDNIATIGITDFAQDALGDVVFIELPEVGTTLAVGDQFAVIESVKAASEVYAPLSGEIVEVNEDLVDAPEAINSSPFDDAWIIKIKLSDETELKELMSENTYKEYMENSE